MDSRKKAQNRVIKWKRAFKKGHEIAAFCDVHETVISRIFNGRGMVSQKSLDKVLDAKEPK